MLEHETVNKLKYMKLTGIAEALKEQNDDEGYREMGFHDRFALLVDREFWAPLLEWIRTSLQARGMIGPHDHDLLYVTDDPADAVRYVVAETAELEDAERVARAEAAEHGMD